MCKRSNQSGGDRLVMSQVNLQVFQTKRSWKLIFPLFLNHCSMVGNPASRKTFGAAFCAVRNVKNKKSCSPMFLLWFLQSCTAGKTQWKVQLSVAGEELFFSRRTCRGLCRQGCSPEHRQGVNAESATHPRAAPFPGFSEWSLLELKGCSWGGGYKFTRGYLAPDSLHKSTSKSEKTCFFFPPPPLFLPPPSNELLNSCESRYDRTVEDC